MRRLILMFMLIAGALTAGAPAARAQSLLFDYVGFDFESPDAIEGEFGEIGSGYMALGTVPFLFAPLVANTAVNEYTFVMSGLTSTGYQTVGSFRIIQYTSGNLTVYSDPKVGGTAADFGTNPPNGVAPSTFEDGTAICSGVLSNFLFVLDTSNGTGSFEATLTITGGTQLANFPLNQRTGWTFSGSSGNALNIPEGYSHQIDGQTFLDGLTKVQRTTWGRLKAGYR